jgi:hypothetical protein
MPGFSVLRAGITQTDDQAKLGLHRFGYAP